MKVRMLANMPIVKSVALLSGKSIGTAFALPDAYDNAMQSHAEALAEAALVLVDPFPLHNLTDRYCPKPLGYHPLVLCAHVGHPPRSADPESLDGNCGQLTEDHFRPPLAEGKSAGISTCHRSRT